MKTILLALLCLSIVLLVDRPTPAQSDEPRFESFHAAASHVSKVTLNPRSHPLARLYRTSLRQQVGEEGVNFAGHYSLVSVGCGTGCSITAIMDARDGKAYFPTPSTGGRESSATTKSLPAKTYECSKQTVAY